MGLQFLRRATFKIFSRYQRVQAVLHITSKSQLIDPQMPPDACWIDTFQYSERDLFLFGRFHLVSIIFKSLYFILSSINLTNTPPCFPRLLWHFFPEGWRVDRGGGTVVRSLTQVECEKPHIPVPVGTALQQ